MFRLNTTGKDKVLAAVLLSCLGAGMPAWAAQPVVQAPIGDFTVNEDDPATIIDLTTVFKDGDLPSVYAVESNTDPAVVSASIAGSTLTLSYLPDASGVAKIVVSATDPDLGTEVAVDGTTVTVLAVNDGGPTPVSQALSTAEDTAVAIVLSATDPDNDPLTYSVGAPSNGTLTGVAPNLNYQPAANFYGSDSFTFTASDGFITSALATVSINVTPVNDAPVAIAQAVGTNEDTPVAIVLAATDPENDSLTYAYTAPSRGVLTGTAPNLT
jgi:hypothetical protein